MDGYVCCIVISYSYLVNVTKYLYDYQLVTHG